MDRIKMAGGMLVGAVVLHLGFVACSGQNTTTGLLGGTDAAAQTMPCTQWEVKVDGQGQVSETARPVEAGWEPFGTFGA
ncbi:MAG: hypothetical protein Q8S73_27015 [Deltaproteobacteria bacterium]|nr:hypothetical protein [Myxococcales bacterium]MDP3217789.1 hypothetical protein [Deltaproteobacteria bacterium]